MLFVLSDFEYSHPQAEQYANNSVHVEPLMNFATIPFFPLQIGQLSLVFLGFLSFFGSVIF